MESAIKYARIFCTAFFAHHKVVHGGHGPVIRKVANDGKPGTAIGAVNEGIIDTVLLQPHVFQAGIAYAYIRADICNAFRMIFTFFYHKLPEIFQNGFTGADILDIRCDRGLLPDGMDEIIDDTFFPFYMQFYAFVAVLYPSRQFIPISHTVYERPESNPLHQTGDRYVSCLYHKECNNERTKLGFSSLLPPQTIIPEPRSGIF